MPFFFKIFFTGPAAKAVESELLNTEPRKGPCWFQPCELPYQVSSLNAFGALWHEVKNPDCISEGLSSRPDHPSIKERMKYFQVFLLSPCKGGCSECTGNSSQNIVHALHSAGDKQESAGISMTHSPFKSTLPSLEWVPLAYMSTDLHPSLQGR